MWVWRSGLEFSIQKYPRKALDHHQKSILYTCIWYKCLTNCWLTGFPPSQTVIRWMTCRQWNKLHFQVVLGSWKEHRRWGLYCWFPVPAHPFMWPWTSPGLSEPVSFLICDMWVITSGLLWESSIQAIIKLQSIKIRKSDQTFTIHIDIQR